MQLSVCMYMRTVKQKHHTSSPRPSLPSSSLTNSTRMHMSKRDDDDRTDGTLVVCQRMMLGWVRTTGKMHFPPQGFQSTGDDADGSNQICTYIPQSPLSSPKRTQLSVLAFIHLKCKISLKKFALFRIAT